MFIRLTTLAVLINQLSAAAVPCRGGVFCIQDIDVDLCGRKDTDVCTTLVLYNSTGHKVQLQGSGNIEGLTGLGLKNISRAEQVGTSGCYTLFKKKNQGNEQYQIKDIGTIHNLGKPRIFRSIKYEQSCAREAGLPWWGILLPLLAVLLLGAGIFIVYRRRRRN